MEPGVVPWAPEYVALHHGAFEAHAAVCTNFESYEAAMEALKSPMIIQGPCSRDMSTPRYAKLVSFTR